MTHFVFGIVVLLSLYGLRAEARSFPGPLRFDHRPFGYGLQGDDSRVPPAPWSVDRYSEGRGDRMGYGFAPIEGRMDEILSNPDGHIRTRGGSLPLEIREVEREDLIDKSAHSQFRPDSEIVDNREPQQMKKSPSAVEGTQTGQAVTRDKNDQSPEPFAAALQDNSHRENGGVTEKTSHLGDVYFVALVAGCSVVAIFGVVAAGYCFYKVQKNSRAAADVDYPAYGVTGPSKESTSPTADRKLAQSAQMYHFQHQKQQMIAVEKNHTNRHTSASDVDTEEENEEGDYTVYECPGLAPTGEMEVKNPLFNDDQTPVSPPVPVTKEEKKKTP